MHNTSSGEESMKHSVPLSLERSLSFSDGSTSRQFEPIAIIGIACRLPGGSSAPAKLWDLLVAGESAHGDVPKSRYNAAAFYHPDNTQPGCVNSTGGYFLQEDISAFDNRFFGIHNYEAMYMDPQQRKLLEVIYESFESAGIPLEDLQGSATGCYVGNFAFDHALMQYRDPVTSRYTATGASPTILANRISHVFDLKGPSMVLDTACSSSIYALHVACAGLHLLDCDRAVVASANLIHSPEMQQVVAKAGILSRDSTCRTFDASADGYGRAEGVSSVVLKRLKDAIRDGDPVRAVIRGTSINSNGRTNGIALPSVDGQEEVIRKAYKRAGLPTDQTDYVEAHGTGTAVGDPIEMEAIGRVFSHHSGRPTIVGSIKTNLGHSEAASGLSSIIKVVLSLEKGVIPPTIGLHELNPKIKADKWNLKIATEATCWPDPVFRRAGVNCFGFGGANSHAILEAASMHVPTNHVYTNGVAASNLRQDRLRYTLITISAGSDISLNKMVEHILSSELVTDARINASELAAVLSKRKAMLPYRGYLRVVSEMPLQSALEISKMKTSHIKDPTQMPFAFVFTGQGAQWSRMGAELFRFSVFAETMRDLDQCLAGLGADSPAWRFEEIFTGGNNADWVSDPRISQPACVALQIGLTELLQKWGITPRLTVGHSSGEIAAAYAAGRLDARRSILAAFFRGLAASKTTQKGAMIAVNMSQSAAQEMLSSAHLDKQVQVACVNSPKSVTLSGDFQAIEELSKMILQDGGYVKQLKTGDKAYHSHHMLAVGESYLKMMEKVWNERNNHVTPLRDLGQVKMISSVSGDEVTHDWLAEPAYWRSNLESPVLFGPASEKLMQKENYHVIEIGPHRALNSMLKQTCKVVSGRSLTYSPTLIRDQDGEESVQILMGTLFLAGYPIKASEINERVDLDVSRIRTILEELPTYPWNYEHDLKVEPRPSQELRHRPYPRHELLGSCMPGLTSSVYFWRNVFDINHASWVKDHCFGPSVVFPAAAYLSMAVEAIHQVHGILSKQDSPGVEIRDFHFWRPMAFTDEQTTIEIFVEMRPLDLTFQVADSDMWIFEVISVTDSVTSKHASGRIRLVQPQERVEQLVNVSGVAVESQAPRVWYRKLGDIGINCGPMFTTMKEVWFDKRKEAQYAVSRVDPLRHLNEEIEGATDYLVHPTIVDALLQTALVAYSCGKVENLRPKVPSTIEKLRIFSASKNDDHRNDAWSIKAKTIRLGFGTLCGNCELSDEQNNIIVQIEKVRSIPFEYRTGKDERSERRPITRVVWKPDIANLGPGFKAGFYSYLQSFQERFDKDVSSETVALACSLDLLVHSNPRLHVLEIASCKDDSVRYLSLLETESTMRRFQSYTRCTMSADKLEMQIINIKAGGSMEFVDIQIQDEAEYDILIIPSTVQKGFLESDFGRAQMSRALYILGGNLGEEYSSTHTDVEKYETLQIAWKNNHIYLARRKKEDQRDDPGQTTDVTLVCHTTRCPLLFEIKEHFLKSFGYNVRVVLMEEVTDSSITKQCKLIVLTDLENHDLESIDEQTMKRLKTITNKAEVLFWVTNAGLTRGLRPSAASVLGLARALVLEQPSLRFAVYDLDDVIDLQHISVLNIARVFTSVANEAAVDLEIAQVRGTPHISRWLPDKRLNEQFRMKQGRVALPTPLIHAGHVQMRIEEGGQIDSIYFQKSNPANSIEAGFVQIEVKAMGMNAKDCYVLTGKIDNPDSICSCEGSGIVLHVGKGVDNLVPGDRVVFMSPGHYGSVETVPSWACHKMHADESFIVTSTVPLVFSTAIYALQYRANAQTGESVLIHSAAGGLGLACIQIAQAMGLKIFATVGNDEKAEFLAESFSIQRDNIFSSRNGDFLSQVLARTAGKGVDIVINSLTGELLHAGVKALASFGRFVEVGKRDILDSGRLGLELFKRDITFTAFDLQDLFYSSRERDRQTWGKLLRQSIEMVRAGTIHPIQPLTVYPVAEISRAFHNFLLGTRIGKIAISYEDPQQIIPVLPNKYLTKFTSEKTYLLVGCLGGLGRCISKWMLSQGARCFVFLGRSGVEKPAATRLIEDLEACGASVVVVKGDVGNYEHVKGAVAACTKPIGGIVQAAMSLSEALWTSMSHESWRTCMDAKVRGTWNLHHALEASKDTALDFFLMSSSIAGTAGTATQSNYCAANAFLDSFARYRRSMGLPATSIGFGMIAEVGYLHEHPEIEKLMQRKGIHPISEEELLVIIDIALQDSVDETAPHAPCQYDTYASAHILTGCEFIGLEEQRRQGFEGNNHVLDDPRAILYAATYARETSELQTSSPTTDGLASDLASALQTGDEARLSSAIECAISQKVSNLILLAKGELKSDTRFADFGFDSMLAAELRGYVFHTMKVDIPFMALLDPNMSVGKVTRQICDGMLE